MNTHYGVYAGSYCKSKLKLHGFDAYTIEGSTNNVPRHSQEKSYSIALFTGKHIGSRRKCGVASEGAILAINHPRSTHFREDSYQQIKGYACDFTDKFLKMNACSRRLERLLLGDCADSRLFTINEGQALFLASIFKMLILEQSTAYVYKDEMVHDYIDLILHEALKMQTLGNVKANKPTPNKMPYATEC